MAEATHHLLVIPSTTTPKLPNYPSKPPLIPITSTIFPNYPSKPLPPPPPPSLHISATKSKPLKEVAKAEIPCGEFQAKLLYLDSLGIDLLSLLPLHPSLLTTPLSRLRSAAAFLLSPAVNLSPAALRRVAHLCPESLTLSVPHRLAPVITFLLTEARVPKSSIAAMLLRRPRILACPVASHLRPTLLFLRSLGIPFPHRHPTLLTADVERKLIPRLCFLRRRLGFSAADAASMVRRFPPLFCYSAAENLQPKFDFFVLCMRRDPRELRRFPQYFSFSLDCRIVPRHQACVARRVCFPLPVLLRSTEADFRRRLDVCCETSLPRSHSPLFSASHLDDLHGDGGEAEDTDQHSLLL